MPIIHLFFVLSEGENAITHTQVRLRASGLYGARQDDRVSKH